MTDYGMARKAFDLCAQGWATGDFAPYLAMLADEMMFWFPMGAHRGQFSGPNANESTRCALLVAAPLWSALRVGWAVVAVPGAGSAGTAGSK